MKVAFVVMVACSLVLIAGATSDCPTNYDEDHVYGSTDFYDEVKCSCDELNAFICTYDYKPICDDISADSETPITHGNKCAFCIYVKNILDDDGALPEIVSC